MFASMSNGALTAVCVFLSEWMCVCVWGHVRPHSALRQCIPRLVRACVRVHACVCVRARVCVLMVRAANGTEWKPTADPSSLGYTNKCVRQQVSACRCELPGSTMSIFHQSVCVCVGGGGLSSTDRWDRRDQIGYERVKNALDEPSWRSGFLILLHYGARHLSLFCQQMCQYKNGNATVRQHNAAHSQTLFFSPSLFCPFSLWCLSITACTSQFIWKTLLMCCDKHIACKWDSLLEHMARMFPILKACWLSDSASPNVKHIWKCR